MSDKGQEAYDASLDKQYTSRVPFFQEESVVSRLAITKEMFNFELENFDVSEQAGFQMNITGSFQTDVVLQSSNVLTIAVNSLYLVHIICVDCDADLTLYSRSMCLRVSLVAVHTCC